MRNKFDRTLFPLGTPSKSAKSDVLELYKIMVLSSENLVNRRQGLNTYFLTINAAVVSAAGFVLGAQLDSATRSVGLAALTIAGAVLSGAWWMLLRSFGQLNTGKFVVINELEKYLPAGIYSAEWVALGEGLDPKKYRSFTEREVWVPRLFLVIYILAFAIQVFTLISNLETPGSQPLPATSTTQHASPTPGCETPLRRCTATRPLASRGERITLMSAGTTNS